ncbi:MAG: cytochrome c maturation protein CcmE [Pseudomonadota bacterium]|nr:cytochrome c maturation protein CcmE [Pseudomonadota bacterium]
MSQTHWSRLKQILVTMLVLSAVIVLVVVALNQHIQAYVTPQNILSDASTCRGFCRLGALVRPGSLQWLGNHRIQFWAQMPDASQMIKVEYHGDLPALFKEGRMMLAEGTMQSGVFKASQILAKHDENYRPKISQNH